MYSEVVDRESEEKCGGHPYWGDVGRSIRHIFPRPARTPRRPSTKRASKLPLPHPRVLLTQTERHRPKTIDLDGTSGRRPFLSWLPALFGIDPASSAKSATRPGGGRRGKSAAIGPNRRVYRCCVAWERQVDSRAGDEGHPFVGESESL